MSMINPFMLIEATGFKPSYYFYPQSKKEE